jgi:cobalamin-dependent methionine synthase I
MIATLLKEDGYRVEFLGADLPVDDLVAYTDDVKPAAVLLSATSEWSAAEMSTLQERLARLQPAPIFGYGGQAFVRFPELRSRVPGIFLGETAAKGCSALVKLLKR